MQKRFGLKLWLRGSDNTSFLKAQLLILARELELVDEKTPLEAAMKILHQYLTEYPARFGKPWLAVFDNADTLASLASYLPASGGQVIVTTRSPSWPGVVVVDIMKLEEGCALVSKLLQREDPDRAELCRTLGFLPLGIAQACAYIRNERLKISTYLKQFHANTALLARDERLFGIKLPTSLLNLWEITFAALDRSCPEALELLHTLAYLSPDGICKEIMQAFNNPIAQKALYDYGLLNFHGNTVHRLLQMAVRHRQHKHAESTCTKAMETIDEIYFLIAPTSSQIDTNKQLIPHGKLLISYCKTLHALTPHTLHAFAQTLNWFGHCHHTILGQARQAIPLQTEALAIYKKMYGSKHTNVAITLNHLGSAYDALGEHKKAAIHHQEALAIKEKLESPNHITVVASLCNLASAHESLGEYPKAIKLLKRALDITKKSHSPEHSSIARILTSLCSVYIKLGEYSKALEYCDEALELNKKNHGSEHPHVAMVLSNLGDIYVELGKPSKAIRYYKEALEIENKAYGPEHPHVATSLNNLGVAYNRLGKHATAISYYKKSLAIHKKIHGPEHTRIATDLNNLGIACNELERHTKAIKYFEEALTIRKKMYSPDHPSVADILNNLGTVYARLAEDGELASYGELGNHTKAVKCYKEALNIYIKNYGPGHPSVERVQENLLGLM